MSDAGTAAAGTVAQRSVADGAAVVASLRYKMIHCIDEQRDVQRYHDVEQFTRSFDQLVTTPEFVASIDSWP